MSKSQSAQRRELLRATALRSASGFIACGFGSGLSPIAPGTMGSLAALLPAYLYVYYFPGQPWWVTAILLVLSFMLGVWACDRAGQKLGVPDHGGLVWDEFVGQWLVLCLVPVSLWWWLSAFIAFRLFDIVKPWPIRWFDKHVKGGFGVMLDDVLAAVFAIAVLAVCIRFL